MVAKCMIGERACQVYQLGVLGWPQRHQNMPRAILSRVGCTWGVAAEESWCMGHQHDSVTERDALCGPQGGMK